MNFLDSVFNYVKEVYTDQLPYFPTNIRTSLFITLFCVIALAELYLYILFRRVRKEKQIKEEKKWKNRIGNILANIVVFDESDNAEDIVRHFYPKFKKFPLKDEVVIKILIAEIITYHKNFIGRPLEILEVLYRKLKLDEVSKAKIKNKKWEIKVQGIREAKEMRITEIAEDIINYTDARNGFLRMEAQATYIKLSVTDHFHFLDRTNALILDWHQVVLLEIITKNKQLQIPSFAKWLASPNDTVVMLCLKLVAHFMQFEAEQALEKLLKHKNPEIVKKSIEVIGKLELENVEKGMFEVYFDQSDDVKLGVLNSLGKISSGNYKEFLSSRIYSDNIKLKRAALYAIKKQPDGGAETLKEMSHRANSANQALIKHVLDNRIKE